MPIPTSAEELTALCESFFLDRKNRPNTLPGLVGTLRGEGYTRSPVGGLAMINAVLGSYVVWDVAEEIKHRVEYKHFLYDMKFLKIVAREAGLMGFAERITEKYGNEIELFAPPIKITLH